MAEIRLVCFKGVRLLKCRNKALLTKAQWRCLDVRMSSFVPFNEVSSTQPSQLLILDKELSR
jgi:hypothetical protein